MERHHPPTTKSILTRKCRWGSCGFTLTKPRRCTCWVCPPLLFREAIWEFSVACQNYGRHYDSVIITRQTGRVERQLKMAEVACCRLARPLMIAVLRPSPYMGGSRGPPTAASVSSRVNKKPKTKWMRGGGTELSQASDVDITPSGRTRARPGIRMIPSQHTACHAA